MERRHVLVVVAALITAALAIVKAEAPDVSGAWSGTIAIPEKGQRQKSPLFASLKQNGDELIGTIGPEENAQLPISKGRVESTKYGTFITFDLPASSFVMHFELRPYNGTMRGVARLDGEKATAPVELTQAK